MLGAALLLSAPAGRSVAATTSPRQLGLVNLHTGERLDDVLYWDSGAYVPDALSAIAGLLRDHRSGEVHPIDPALLDLLHGLRGAMDVSKPFAVISAYRSAATNAMLRRKSRGVAKRSLHMQGKAVDVRLPGSSLDQMHRAALSLRGGGVGYYGRSNFLHLDTGRVRSWGRA
jgi:uncharacterized protein YcbK (DUF882 family)